MRWASADTTAVSPGFGSSAISDFLLRFSVAHFHRAPPPSG
jgi:hypothetical protein